MGGTHYKVIWATWNGMRKWSIDREVDAACVRYSNIVTDARKNNEAIKVMQAIGTPTCYVQVEIDLGWRKNANPRFLIHR
jgi:hypothetical protein